MHQRSAEVHPRVRFRHRRSTPESRLNAREDDAVTRLVANALSSLYQLRRDFDSSCRDYARMWVGPFHEARIGSSASNLGIDGSSRPFACFSPRSILACLALSHRATDFFTKRLFALRADKRICRLWSDSVGLVSQFLVIVSRNSYYRNRDENRSRSR